jgi:hypothetical protein
MNLEVRNSDNLQWYKAHSKVNQNYFAISQVETATDII